MSELLVRIRTFGFTAFHQARLPFRFRKMTGGRQRNVLPPLRRGSRPPPRPARKNGKTEMTGVCRHELRGARDHRRKNKRRDLQRRRVRRENRKEGRRSNGIRHSEIKTDSTRKRPSVRGVFLWAEIRPVRDRNRPWCRRFCTPWRESRHEGGRRSRNLWKLSPDFGLRA